MVDKFGSDQQQLANSGGSVISQDDAVLLNGDSDGETALLFGPAALREIQAGVANGDFAIAPPNADATITEDNALPYWTFTDVNSAGAITCAVVADASAGSGNVLRWTINAGTLTGKSAQISRYIPIASSRDRALTIVPDAYVSEGIGTNAQFKLTYSYVKQDLTTTGTGATGTPRSIAGSIGASPTTAPSDAAYVYVVITLETTGTTAALTGDLAEVKLRSFFSAFFITDNNDSATYAAAAFEQGGGNLIIGANGGTGQTAIAGTFYVSGDATFAGANSNWLARVSATATQSLTNNATTKVTFNTASSTPTTDSYDPQGWFDNANDRIVIGQAGFYTISANCGFASNATGRRLVQIFVNGADRGGLQVAASTTATTILSTSTNVYLAVNDYVEVFATQQSGGALNTVFVAGVYPSLSLGRIGA
jgi:hypothetical protein